MTRKGDTWNESQTYRDAWTRRVIRQVTSAGCYNVTPTYHTGTAWTADGERFVFASGRAGKSALFVCKASSGDITQLIDWVDGMAVGGGKGLHGGVCVSPNAGWATYVYEGALRAVHIDTLQERTLIDNVGPWAMGSTSIDPDEQYAVVVANIVPQPMRVPSTAGSGEHFTKGRADYFNEPGGAHLRVLRTPLNEAPSDGSQYEIIYDEPGIRSGHVQYCPADPDLLLIDRDFPPRFWFGSDGKTNRIWTLRISNGALTELPSRAGALFQVHSTWNWRGDKVLYHCPTPEGYVIGVDDVQGRTLWEHQAEDWKLYGHVSAMAGRPAFILDGNLSDDLLLWMYYDAELPRVEVVARHGTTWTGHEGQYPHPHPQSDPTGRYITFNAAQRGQSNVFVVEV
jgi:hypothetical protein